MTPTPNHTSPAVAVAAILSLAAVGITALVKGYNGTLMILIVAAIAGTAGFTIRDITSVLSHRKPKPD